MPSEANYLIKYLKNDRSLRRIYKKSNWNELKTELIYRGLGTQGTKQILLNRLLKAIQDKDITNTERKSGSKPNETERNISNSSDANISLGLSKEILTNMFKEGEEKLLNIVRNGISDTKTFLDRLKQEISNKNIKLNALRKETDDFKLSLETLYEITDNKFKEINNKLNNHKQQNGNEIDELWQKNEYLRQKLRDMEDRSWCDYIRIHGLEEVENKAWEQMEQILKSMIEEKLEIEDVNIQIAHMVSNTSNTSARRIIANIISWYQLASATMIHDVLTNTITDSETQSGILKTNISNHLVVFCLMKTSLV